MSEEDEFGSYKITVKREALGARKRYGIVFCTECGEEDGLTDQFTASWNVLKQEWMMENQNGGDPYCSNCECETSLDERFLSPGEIEARGLPII